MSFNLPLLSPRIIRSKIEQNKRLRLDVFPKESSHFTTSNGLDAGITGWHSMPCVMQQVRVDEGNSSYGLKSIGEILGLLKSTTKLPLTSRGPWFHPIIYNLYKNMTIWNVNNAPVNNNPQMHFPLHPAFPTYPSQWSSIHL